MSKETNKISVEEAENILNKVTNSIKIPKDDNYNGRPITLTILGPDDETVFECVCDNTIAGMQVVLNLYSDKLITVNHLYDYLVKLLEGLKDDIESR